MEESAQASTLLFTGLVSPFVVVLLFAAAVAITIWLYRKHNLPKPWDKILPALRILVLAMLMLMLLQPVWARFSHVRVRGQIPVIIDSSGSMTTVDEYEEHRQIDICWHLEFFDKPIRNTVFNEKQEDWQALGKDLLTAEEAAAALKDFQLDPSEEEEGAFRRERKHVDQFRKMLRGLSKDLAKMHATFDESVAGFDYLRPDRKRQAGRVSWRRYDGIGGSVVNDLTRASKYPDKPDADGTFTKLESFRNKGDNYGLRIEGFLLPPKTGKYTFYKESDDESEFWLSKDDNPAHLKRVMDGRTGELKNRSLKEEQAYCFRVLMKEGSGNDYVRVGWQRPDGKRENAIPGSCLAELDPDGRPDFPATFETFMAGLNEQAETLGKIDEELDDLEKDGAKRLKDQLTRYRNCMERYRAFQDQLPELQKLADETLHRAGIPEVDDAVKRLSEMKRADLVKFVLTEKPYRLLDRLRSRGEVQVYNFDEKAEPVEEEEYERLEGELAATRVGSILNRVMNRYEKKPVAGVVMFSDGNNNAGLPVADVRKSVDERAIPIHALGVGAEKPPPDVAIARAVAPRTSFKDDNLNVSVALHRHGHTNKTINLKLLSGDEVLVEEEVEPGGDAEVVVDLSFAETNAGMRVYRVEAEKFKEDEAFDHNNEKSFTVNILKDRILTLCVDEFPRWETRYANMMLKRDKRVDLETIFVASTPEGELPTEKGGYPDSRDALFKYHILILGDVDPNHFTTEQMEHIRDFVVERGGTLIAMAGPHHMPSGYKGTPLADVLPLDRMGRAGGTNGTALVFEGDALSFKDGLYQPNLREETSYEDVLQIGRNPEDTRELWNRLPRLIWLKEDVTIARSADNLVDAEAKRGESVAGAAPVMIKSYSGLGKVLYLGSDSFWRWRYKARWKYHHRFWGQILLWSTMGRTTGADKHVKLMADRPMYAPEEPIVIKARLLDENELPLARGDASVEIYGEEDSLVKRVPLFYLPNSGGEYRAEVRDLERGAYRIIPKVQELDHLDLEAEVKIEVRDLPTSEYVDLELNTTALNELSKDVLTFEKAMDVVKEIDIIDEREERRSDLEIWDSWPYLLILAGLLAVEWMLRKRCRLA